MHWEVQQEKECLCSKKAKETVDKIKFQANNTFVFSRD